MKTAENLDLEDEALRQDSKTKIREAMDRGARLDRSVVICVQIGDEVSHSH